MDCKATLQLIPVTCDVRIIGVNCLFRRGAVFDHEATNSTSVYLRKENARRDREYKPSSEYTEEERYAEREKGDNASFYRYTV